MIDDINLAWMGIGISIGGVIATVIWGLGKYVEGRVERETRNWLRQHNGRGESYDR